MTAADLHRTIDAVWRIESARLIAGLARIVRDVGLAEELAQEALVAALEKWPESGVPDNPGAWLMATAKNRAIDELKKSGKLIATEGRKAGAPGMKIRMRQGQLSVKDGPFTEAKELVGGFALMNVDSREEIVTLTRRFLEIAGDGESEIIEMFEAPEQHG